MIRTVFKGEVTGINLGNSSKCRVVIPGSYLVEAVELLQFKDISFIIGFKYDKEDGTIIKTIIRNAIFKNISFNDDGECKFDFGINFGINSEDVNLNELNSIRGVISLIQVRDTLKKEEPSEGDR